LIGGLIAGVVEADAPDGQGRDFPALFFRTPVLLPSGAGTNLRISCNLLYSMAQNAHTSETGEDVTVEPAAPITSRFLFVDVAAQRAKQLRRGALPRLERPASSPHKLERVAMEEVKQGVIQYTLPTTEEVQRGRGRD
jgi:DNA-directed RNA polymerase subunit K/omega